jgi:hypothetical protein
MRDCVGRANGPVSLMRAHNAHAGRFATSWGSNSFFNNVHCNRQAIQLVIPHGFAKINSRGDV